MDAGADHTVLIALLAAGTAILAALIAAASADIRQRRQLKHDRRLQDLAELRSVLDEAGLALEEAIHHLAWVWVGFNTEYVRAEEDEAVKRLLERKRAADYSADMKKCADVRDAMMRAGRRVAIRLGDHEPLYRTYQSAIGLVIETISEIGKKKAMEDAGAVVSQEDFAELNSGLAALRKLFVTRAVARVGSDLDQ